MRELLGEHERCVVVTALATVLLGLIKAEKPELAHPPQHRVRHGALAVQDAGGEQLRAHGRVSTAAAIQELAPRTILAQASRLQFSTRLYNLLLSNVPGPQFPVDVLGRELRSFVPVAFLAEDKRLAVAIASYNGRATISVLSDSDHIDDLDDLMAAIRRSVDELRDAGLSSRTSQA